ncbi:MAG: hypothetical protein ACRD0U_11080 [Acidimicrobiales bacterium]
METRETAANERVTPPVAARRLGRDIIDVLWMMDRGELRRVRDENGQVVIDARSLDEYLAQQR